MFMYKRHRITLENYKQVFKVCTPDVLDEIRSAILDDTPIGGYIEVCGSDSYKLGQIRLALRELVPTYYICTAFTGVTINRIRGILSGGGSVDSLMRYTNSGMLTISASSIEIIADFMWLGYDMSKVDFTQVPTDMVKEFCIGVSQNYPMWLLYDVPKEKLEVLKRGMQLGLDIHPFLNKDWGVSTLYCIFSHASSINIDKLVSCITPKFSVEYLDYIIRVMKKSDDWVKLTIHDKEGYPLYSEAQVSIICDAVLDGWIKDDMFNFSLSPKQMLAYKR